MGMISRLSFAFRSISTTIALCGLVVSAAAISTISQVSAAKVLAKINNKEITVDEFEKRYSQNAKLVPGSAPSKIDVLNNVIYFELAVQEAKKRGLEKSPDVEEKYNIILYQTLVQQQIQPKIDALKISEKAVRDFYDQSPLVKTSHIVFLTRPDMKDQELKDLYARAEKIQKEAVSSPTKFADLARKHSEGPQARTGGDVDWGARHKLLPEYYEAALQLKNVNDISPVVQTPYGLHIIQLKGRRAFKDLDAGYRDYIVRTLKEQQGRAVYAEYFEGLKSAGKVSINADLLK